MKPYRVTLLLATLIVVAAVSLLAAPPVAAKPLKCASDQVPVGTTCVDKFEASVWSIPAANTGLIKQVQDGRATFAGLTAGGASQVSLGFCVSPFPGSFPATGNWTAPLYAASIAGVPPSACITWFQAEQACALSGKRLLTNQEWQRAAAGTPDPGTDNGTTDCAISGAGGPVNTGSRSACVSNWGAFDMVGNVWEWVGDWGTLATGCTFWSGTFGLDISCTAVVSSSSPTLPGALIRGGSWGDGTDAGVFAVDVRNDPSLTTSFQVAFRDIGFRCAR